MYTRTRGPEEGAAQKGLEVKARVCRDNSRALTVTTRRSDPFSRYSRKPLHRG